MKVTYITSAAVEVEHDGFRVLCDPWFTDGAYHGSWFHYPPLAADTVNKYLGVDAIYLSHIHPDHFDPGTLAHFRKDIPVFICEYEEKYFLRHIQALGFTNVKEVPNRGTVTLKPGFEMEIMAADDCNPASFALAYQTRPIPSTGKTRQIDSLAIFRAGREVLMNTNDVPWALLYQAFPYIKQKYGTITCMLVSYAGAGPFPQCFMHKTREELAGMAIETGLSYLRGTIEYIKFFEPDYYIPFAGQYTIGGKNSWMNIYKGVLDLDDLPVDFEKFMKQIKAHPQMVLLNHEGSLDLTTKKIEGAFTGTDFAARERYVKEVLASKKYDYEDSPDMSDEEMDRQVAVARERLLRKQRVFHYFSERKVYMSNGKGKYYCIPFDTSPAKLVEASEISSPSIVADLDRRLFAKILRREANWNNAEVGSHMMMKFVVDPGVPSYEPMLMFLMPYFQGEAVVPAAAAA